MILSAHQPAYLPWAGYLHRIAISDYFVILDNVQFEKNSFTNRNQIKGPSGLAWLTVPVNLKGHLTSTIHETRITEGGNWALKHLKTIQQNYAKAPFFAKHADFFRDALESKWLYISELNRFLLDYLLEQFQIGTPLINQSELNVEGKNQELILAMCRKFKADTFVFGIHGKDYVNPVVFKTAGVKLCFHEYTSLTYPQLWGEFVPNLSVLDMLFNVSPDELHDLLFTGGSILRSDG